MGIQIASKLNQLQHDLPEGLVVDAAWLEGKGYSSALRSKYAGRRRLEQVARGVYRRPGAQLPDPNKKDGRASLAARRRFPADRPRQAAGGGRPHRLELQGFAH